MTLDAAVRATMPVSGKTIPKLLLMNGSRGQNPSEEEMAKPFTVLMGLAGFVLLLACANLAEPVAGARPGAAAGDECAHGGGRGARAHGAADANREPVDFLLGGAAGLALAYAVRNGIRGCSPTRGCRRRSRHASIGGFFSLR